MHKNKSEGRVHKENRGRKPIRLVAFIVFFMFCIVPYAFAVAKAIKEVTPVFPS